jgi:hypothetical protein
VRARLPRLANRKVREACTLRRATAYGGLNALSDFVHAQGIDAALDDAFGRDKAPWATYSLPETLRHLLDGYLLGVERVWHFAELEQEPLLCVKCDRDRLPDFTLLYRELARFEDGGRPCGAAGDKRGDDGGTLDLTNVVVEQPRWERKSHTCPRTAVAGLIAWLRGGGARRHRRRPA